MHPVVMGYAQKNEIREVVGSAFADEIQMMCVPIPRHGFQEGRAIRLDPQLDLERSADVDVLAGNLRERERIRD